MSPDLRTDDEIARLFADANPIPNDRDAGGRTSSGAQEWTEIALGEHRPDPTSEVEREPRTARWLLAAAAATVLVVGVAVVAFGQDDPAAVDGSTPGPPTVTTPDTLPPTRLQVANAFVTAVSAHDAAAANRQLLPGVVPALVAGADLEGYAPATVEDQFAWFEAFDWTWQIESCRENGDIGAECTIRQRNRLSDLVALDFPARLLFAFEDGRIERLNVTHDLGEYGPQAFLPFYRWVAQQSPEDAERLWRPRNRGLLPPIITQDTAELMDAYLTEYTATHGDIQAAMAADVAAAEAFVAAFNARDETSLRSLVAGPDEFDRVLLDGRDAPTSFAWFDALGTQWSSPECALDDDVVLGCEVVERNDLTDATGLARAETVRFSVVDGRIDDFAAATDGEYATGTLEPFVEWLAATHPEDLRTMVTLHPANRWISPNPNDATIPLFESYVAAWTSGDERPVPAHRTLLTQLADGDAESARSVLASDATVDLLWAATTDDLPGLSKLLDGLEWSWNVESCAVSRDDPDPVSPEVRCVATPTSRLETGDATLGPVVVEFRFTRDGIASVSTGSWVARSDLTPVFDWIRTARPDAADAVLTDWDGTTVPVLTEGAATRFVELVDDYLAAAGE